MYKLIGTKKIVKNLINDNEEQHKNIHSLEIYKLNFDSINFDLKTQLIAHNKNCEIKIVNNDLICVTITKESNNKKPIEVKFYYFNLYYINSNNRESRKMLDIPLSLDLSKPISIKR